MHLLDTDHMTLLEREGPGVEELRARLATLPLDDVATTIVSYEEQTRGWLAVMAQTRTPEAQVRAYRRLKAHIEIYCKIPALDFDDKAAAEFARLRQARVRIGTMDLKIAAIALANDATLLTRNLSDFGKVPNLRAENWTL